VPTVQSSASRIIEPEFANELPDELKSYAVVSYEQAAERFSKYERQ